MQIKTESLEALLAINKFQSFSRAAEALRITQPALTKRIQFLERQLDLNLIIRGTRPVQLTETGKKILTLALSYEQMQSDTLSHLHAHNVGHVGLVRIAASSSHMRPLAIPSLKDFAKKHSEVHFEFLPRPVSDLVELLMRNRVDFIIRDKPLLSSDIENIHLGDESFGVVEPSVPHPDRFIGTDPADETFYQFMNLQKKSLRHSGFEQTYMGDVYGIFDGVRMGFGKSIVPLHMVRDFRKGLRICAEYEILKAPIYLSAHKQFQRRVLLDAIANELKNGFAIRINS